MKYSFIILFLLLISSVDAWNFKGHQSIVEIVYYASDFKLQEKLNLTLLKEGAIVPDHVFHDVRLHHYPPSYNLAEKWLNSAKEEYDNKNYNNASYSFGVASHYISDSFIAPHYISREPGSLHSEFETQAIKNFNEKIKCYKTKINLNETLFNGTKNKDDWILWTLSKNETIPKREYLHALNATFPIFLEIFNSTCNNFHTEIIKQKFHLNFKVIIFIILILIYYLFYILNKKYKLIKRIRF
jgi:hypothetical protein